MEKNRIIQDQIIKYWDDIQKAYDKSPDDFITEAYKCVFAYDELWDLNDKYYRELYQDFSEFDLDCYDLTEEEIKAGADKFYNILKEYAEIE